MIKTLQEQLPQPVVQEKGKRPTKRAIRMVNALRLEQMPHAGQFRSLADIRMTYGIPIAVFYLGVDLPKAEALPETKLSWLVSA